MAHTLGSDDARGLIEVAYSGDITIAERLHVIEAAEALLDSTGYKRVIVDWRAATSRTEPLDLSNALATRLAVGSLQRGSSIAFVVPPGSHDNVLVSNLARARHATLETFTDRDRAIAWLLAQR